MMHRWHRTHRSIKIPNVKLRPVPQRVQSEADVAAAEDDAHFRALRDHGVTQGAHTAADFGGEARTPLRGVVLSFTGITEKRELAEIAEQLGARVCANLTSDVTHLVARTPGSAKYHAAVQFRMWVVRPEWLYAVREAWMAGEDHVDRDRLALECRLGALEGLTLAVTGVHAQERAALERRIEALGARISKLVWDGSVTHLVCVGDDTERPRRGLAKVLALRQPNAQTDLAHTRAALQIRLVHAAWIDDCEATGVLVPEAEYDALRPLEANARAARVAALAAQPLERTQSAPAPPETLPPPPPLAPAVESSEPLRGSVLAYSREARFAAPPRGVLAERTFYIDMADEARTRRVVQVVRRAGGIVLPMQGAGAEKTAEYAVGPLSRPLRVAAHTYVTHHWVERCLYEDAVVDPQAHVALRPATEPLPQPEASHWRIALTGIPRESPEYHHTCAAIEALGGTVMDAFSRRATHLLCGPSAQSIKVAKAAEWHIPTVDMSFLEKALRGGAPGIGERGSAAPAAPIEPDEGGAALTPRPSSGTEEPTAAMDTAPRAWTRTPSSSTNYSDSAADAPRRRARPRRHGTRPDVARPETHDLTAPVALGADAQALPAEAGESHVWYDDPAARREQTRLLALVDELAAERPAKRAR
ncbi:protein kinase activating protein dpb11 [Malassezia nana]|uniref:Protein kinase activating protein dpb11 n=1 Tax=Malassezia nana TaxID=180528 RepID=A0AAF0J5A6_9BASI|nr:protein kinase activating protein dpb11 [Malassezia nana]